MKTKKFIQALTALALCATMTAPVNALAADIEAGEETKISDVGTAKTGETPIEMTIDAQYVVTIPKQVILYDDTHETSETGTQGDGVYTGKGTLIVNEVHLDYGQTLKVTVDTHQSSVLTCGSVNVDYAASLKKDGDELDAGKEILTCDSQAIGSADQTKDIFFKTTSPVVNSGEYSGNFTFHLIAN